MDREKNATVLKQLSSQKLLGVTIDQKLSFDDHIDKLCNKLCQRIAVLSKIKKLKTENFIYTRGSGAY